jgi:hypothetical protein
MRRSVAVLRQEMVASLGLAGAAMTVLMQAANFLPLAPWLAWALEEWRDTVDAIWHPPLEALGLALHPHLVAAATLSIFMLVMTLGARITVHLAPQSSTGLQQHFQNDFSWPSAVVFVALILIFLFGHDKDPPNSRLVISGSAELGKLVFGLAVSSGYIFGDVIGGAPFHRRLVRLGVLVTAVLALNFVILKFSP